VKRRLPLIVLGTLLPGSAMAEPWELAGSSMRDLSMAGAGAAGSVPGSAIPMDPASVAAVDGETISVAWRGTYPSVQIDDLTVMEGPVHALDVAIAFGGPIGEVRGGGGFSMYLPLPNAVESVVHMEADELHAPLLEDAVDFVTFDMAAGMGLGPVEFAVGAAVGIDLKVDTTVRVRALNGEPTDDGGLDLTKQVDVGLDRRLVWTAAPLVGVRLRHQNVGAFVSYRGQSGFRTEGDTDIGFDFEGDAFDDFFIDVDMPISYLSVWTPARVALGVSAPVGRFRPELIAKYQWVSGWRDTQDRKPDPGFVDVPVVGFGLEADVGRGFLARTGYAMHVSPVPEQTGLSRLADADRHVVGLGVGWARGGIPRDNDKTEIALGVQGQHLTPRDVDGSELSGWIWTMTTGVVTRL
jgi:hypothetical protein